MKMQIFQSMKFDLKGHISKLFFSHGKVLWLFLFISLETLLITFIWNHILWKLNYEELLTSLQPWLLLLWTTSIPVFFQTWNIEAYFDEYLRFGGLLVQFHASLLEALQPQLKSGRLAVRKRAIICLGHLVMSCDQILYMKVR